MTDSTATTPPTGSPGAIRIDLYWRPGCGFCAMLRRRLDRLGIERVEHDIWDDPRDAAIVRRYAGGDETVPTVVVDGVGLVNPSVDEVLELVEQRAPHLLPPRSDDPPGLVARIVDRVRGG